MTGEQAATIAIKERDDLISELRAHLVDAICVVGLPIHPDDAIAFRRAWREAVAREL